MKRDHHLPEKSHDHGPHPLNEHFIIHANLPRHMGTLSHANGYAKGVGVRGDAIEVYLSINDQKITDIKHAPRGCAYTVACGSALSHLVYKRTLEEALEITPEDVAKELDGLPEDHMHCASLAVNTLGEAIDDFYQKVWGDKKPAEMDITLKAS